MESTIGVGIPKNEPSFFLQESGHMQLTTAILKHKFYMQEKVLEEVILGASPREM